MADSVVDLGAGGMMSMNEALGLEMGDPGYAGQFPGRIYKEGDTMVDRDYYNDMGDYEFSADRGSPYEGLAESYTGMTDVEVLPMLEDGMLFPNSTSGKFGSNVPVRVERDAEGGITTVPIGFQAGGDVPLSDDGSLPGVDDLRFATLQEVEEGSYRHLQNLQRMFAENLAAAQSPVSDAGGFPVQAAPDNRRYHFEEAARLREEIEDFSNRRALALQNYPESSTKLYVKEGETPYFRSLPDALVEGYAEGGPVEEVGIMGALLRSDIDLPSSADQELVRTSAQEGTEGAAMYYPAGAPTFEEVLEQQYGYPDAEREIYGATTSEAMRAARPRHDMPTYQELEDARAHVLQSALLAKQVGPETAEKFGGMAEMFDRYMPILGTATDADVVMDKRNNAFGAKLLKEAGINATPQEITQMVDQKIFDQLDVVLGRKEGERRFKSPSTGIDIFFPRDKYGYFDVNRYD